jgi:hypothetical protein
MTGTAELATLSGPTKFISQADAVDTAFVMPSEKE